MMITQYLGIGVPVFDEAYVDGQAERLGRVVAQFWQEIKADAFTQAQQLQ